MNQTHTDFGAAVRQAAEWISDADALCITAGAGIGVDSGLPDFRGAEGFWRAYPALKSSGLSFQDIAGPARFELEPARAWGFYGHRLALYRHTAPHAGFGLLRDIAARLQHGAFVFTSNVDGHFQRAGFDATRLIEVHGSIHHLQCQHGCLGNVWSADSFVPEVDARRCELLNVPPRCPQCGDVARPNILMFGDWKWLDHRTRTQQARFNVWYRAAAGKIVTLEIGAGTRVGRVRTFSEAIGRRLIRLNPQHEPCVPSHGIHLRTKALTGLTALYAALVELGVIGVEQMKLADFENGMCRMAQPEPSIPMTMTP